MSEQVHAAKPATRAPAEAAKAAARKGANSAATPDPRAALRPPSSGDRQQNFRASVGGRNETGLPAQLKAGIESLSGFSMDDVRVHRGSPKPALLGALAYAQGSEIHVGPGQERHLPHEAWHVVQQKQGRVRATAQAKGLPLNDWQDLETEADAMGAAALRHGGAPAAFLRNAPLAAGPVQPKMAGLSADDITRLAADYPSADPNAPKPLRTIPIAQRLFDTREQLTEYLVGLWAMEKDLRADQPSSSAMDQGGSSLGGSADAQSSSAQPGQGASAAAVKLPQLYVKIRDVPVGLNKKPVFARVEDVEAKENVDTTEPFKDLRAKLYDEEGNSHSVEDVVAWVRQPAMASRREGSRLGTDNEATVTSERQDIYGSILTGGLPDPANDGDYSGIEFRFVASGGRLHLKSNLDEATMKAVVDLASKRNVDIEHVDNSEFQHLKTVYSDLKLPYAAERVTPAWIYVPQEDLEAMGRGLVARFTGGSPSPLARAPRVEPGTKVLSDHTKSTKDAVASYSGTPPRGERGQGQAAVMGCSAADYAASLGYKVKPPDWEWLHVRASRLGGKNSKDNLVAGTAQANSQMIPYERMIYRAARAAAAPKKRLQVEWKCKLVEQTHIADGITIAVSWDPPITEADSKKDIMELALGANGASIDGIAGAGASTASFTKLDRDLVDLPATLARKTVQ